MWDFALENKGDTGGIFEGASPSIKKRAGQQYTRNKRT
jgi:hypothetical protein